MAEAPAARVPRLQVKLPVPVLGLQLAEVPVRLKPVGHVSLTITLAACDGPLFVTVIVYVRVMPSPAVTVVTPSSFFTDKSALVLTVFVSLAVLLAVLGSDVVLLTVTVLVCDPVVVEGTV